MTELLTELLAVVGTDAVGINEVELALPLETAEVIDPVGISEVVLALLPGLPLVAADELGAVDISEVELALLLGIPLDVEEMGAVGTREVEFALLLVTPLDTAEETEAVGIDDVALVLRDGKPEAVLLVSTVEVPFPETLMEELAETVPVGPTTDVVELLL